MYRSVSPTSYDDCKNSYSIPRSYYVLDLTLRPKVLYPPRHGQPTLIKNDLTLIWKTLFHFSSFFIFLSLHQIYIYIYTNTSLRTPTLHSPHSPPPPTVSLNPTLSPVWENFFLSNNPVPRRAKAIIHCAR